MTTPGWIGWLANPTWFVFCETISIASTILLECDFSATTINLGWVESAGELVVRYTSRFWRKARRYFADAGLADVTHL